ncbi:MAG: hypothetical protein ABIE74_04225 [Pseudomonadota bacterium]
MKKIQVTFFLAVILMSNLAFAQVLGSFEKPQLYTEPAIQLPSSIPTQEKTDLFKIPDSDIEIELNTICKNPAKAIYVDSNDKSYVTNAFRNLTSYLSNSGKYYELCFIMSNERSGADTILNEVVELKGASNEKLPLIISGLKFDSEKKEDKSAGLNVEYYAFLLLHNITIDKSKKGIELNCPNGCLVANSTLTGVPASPPAVSIAIDIQPSSRDVIIQDVVAKAFDIGIDVQGENILLKEISITKNHMYGIRADSSVKNLSLSNIVSLSDNGDGITALDAFMLEEGANSDIGLIKTLADKETFVVPKSTLKDTTARYVEFYRPKTERNLQFDSFLYRYDLKPFEFTKNGDAITVTDHRVQGQYAMVALRTADGSTIFKSIPFKIDLEISEC